MALAKGSFLAATILVLSCSLARAGEDAFPEPSPEKILQSAFDRMFNYPSVRTVTLRIVRGERRTTLRSFDVAYRKIDGLGRTLLRFKHPPYLRGNAILMIEEPNGRSDVWIYQRELKRARRVSASQKADSFYGSDLSFEDLEHHDWQRYDVRRLPDGTEQQRAVFVIEARPPPDSQYSRVVARIEKQRLALLRLELYKGSSEDPVKLIELEADEITEKDGILLPERMWVRQVGRDAATEVVFERIQADREIAESLFAAMRLERTGEDLYKIVEHLREKGESD